MASGDHSNPDDERDPDEELDGCDIEILESDAVGDSELPRTVGGVAIFGIGDDADGCDVEIDDFDAVSDVDLPPAKGGVG